MIDVSSFTMIKGLIQYKVFHRITKKKKKTEKVLCELSMFS